MRWPFQALLVGVVLATAAAYAAEPPSLDEALGGFGEASTPTPELDGVLGGFDDAPAGSGRETPIAEDEARRAFRLGGRASLGVVYNPAHDAPLPGGTDHRGLSAAQARLRVAADLDLPRGWQGHAEVRGEYDAVYALRGRGRYAAAQVAAFEARLDLDETWLRGRLAPSVDVKLGRQRVVWGKSDALRVTDVLNPLDLRVPGLTELVDLRLPLWMSRIDHYRGPFRVTGIVVHESRYDRLPPFASDFHPAPAPLPAETRPGSGPDDWEYALAVGGIFPGWEFAAYGARLYADAAHIATTPAGPRREHARLWMAGFAANAVRGSWLYKAEMAHFSGLRFAALPGATRSRLDLLLGIEYAGIAHTSLALEVVNRHLHGYDARLATAPDLARRDDAQAALRITHSFRNDTVNLVLLATTWLDGGGGFQRLEVNYDVSDGVEVVAGFVNYDAGNRRNTRGIGDNDRLFLRLERHF